jgi:V/A-type H+-transporting ATPase subunit A
MVTVAFDGNIMQNEVAYIIKGKERLKSEIVRIGDGVAYLQVFESTKGLRVGDDVEFSGELLSVQLGPGLLGQVYDGLQNPLPGLAAKHGFFLPRGVELPPLDEEKEWEFTPAVKKGDVVLSGIPLGHVPEGIFQHAIMLPFHFSGEYTIEFIAEKGKYKITDTIAVVKDNKGNKHDITMTFFWPVKIPITAYREKIVPTEPLVTQARIIDTFFPVAKGGTFCIPGPFGAGKTVLQHILSRHAQVDVVIVAACGERAGEVV